MPLKIFNRGDLMTGIRLRTLEPCPPLLKGPACSGVTHGAARQRGCGGTGSHGGSCVSGRHAGPRRGTCSLAHAAQQRHRKHQWQGALGLRDTTVTRCMEFDLRMSSEGQGVLEGSFPAVPAR